MSATLSLYSLTIAHGDTTASNNPSLRYVDWKRKLEGVSVKNPKSEAASVSAGQEALIFDGTRSTSLDNTSSFDLTANPIASDRYRITHSGGTNPVFRTDRGVNLSGIALTIAALTNGSLTVTAGSGTPFSAVQAGDQVFIPGVATGDATGPFGVINQGFWDVLAATSTVLTLVRPADADFIGIGESVTPVAQNDFQVFSSTGVQIGDKVQISAGFSASNRKTFEIIAVTGKFIEFLSSSPLAAESGKTPTTTGMQFFVSCKRFLRIEADQECALKLNGDTGILHTLSPWTAGDPTLVAEFTMTGPVWQLKILNKSTATLTVSVISCE